MLNRRHVLPAALCLALSTSAALAQQELTPISTPAPQAEAVEMSPVPNFVQLGTRCLAKQDRAFREACNHAINELEAKWRMAAAKGQLASNAEARGNEADAREFSQQGTVYYLGAQRATRQFREEYPEVQASNN